MSVFTDLLDVAFPLVLKAAQSLADSQVDGASLSKDQKQHLWVAYNAIKTNLGRLAQSTSNQYADQGLDALAEFCKDTLGEAGIQVPEIPAELLD